MKNRNKMKSLSETIVIEEYNRCHRNLDRYSINLMNSSRQFKGQRLK